MPIPPSPEDRPDPNDQIPPVRARVTEHVARGDISTGVIVVTGGTEFVLDFVRNLPRPNMIVARIVLPHMVMPQFIEALSTNIELYRQRYGDLPGSTPVISLAVDSHIVTAGTSTPAPPPPRAPCGIRRTRFGTPIRAGEPEWCWRKWWRNSGEWHPGKERTIRRESDSSGVNAAFRCGSPPQSARDL